MDKTQYSGGVVFKLINKDEIDKKYRHLSSPDKMKAYIDKLHAEYIALTSKSGIDFGGKDHGMFGYINNSTDVEEMDIDSIGNHVVDISKKNIDILKTVISLSPEDAIKYGFTTKQAWIELLRR